MCGCSIWLIFWLSSCNYLWYLWMSNGKISVNHPYLEMLWSGRIPFLCFHLFIILFSFVYTPGIHTHVISSDAYKWAHVITNAWDFLHTVWCRCNAVDFLTNSHEINPIARPLGRVMGCILWIQTLDLYFALVCSCKRCQDTLVLFEIC